MLSEAFPTGMPRGTPREGVPGHGCTVRSKCDSIRPHAIRARLGLTKRCRTTAQAAPHAPGGDPKSRRAGFSRASKLGSTGCRRWECWTSSRTDTWDVRESGLMQPWLRGTCAGWAKVRLKTRHYREQQTKECVAHVPRGRDRPPVHAQHATTAARVVRCPFVRNTLHRGTFLMQCLD